MPYTKIPPYFRKRYLSLIDTHADKKPKDYYDYQLNKPDWESFFLFMWKRLDTVPRDYQCYAVHRFLTSKSKRVALCWARQMGKSIGLGGFSLWTAWYNLFPATVEKLTIWYLVSRDDETAVELLQKMRGLLYKGDNLMGDKFFTSKLSGLNNTHQITFYNRCFIKSVPPTQQVLGKSGNIIIDEFAKLKLVAPLNDKRFLYEVAEPITSQTNGLLIISSTPDGIGNEFYTIFDPENKVKKHTYDRIWFDYSMCKDRSYQKFVKDKKKEMEQTGNIKIWQQEYQAIFTVTSEQFFDPEVIESCTDKTLSIEYESSDECTMAIDYGMKHSRTVITITAAKQNNRGEYEIRLLNLIRYPPNHDYNMLLDNSNENSIPSLCKRYMVTNIVVDDCPQGYSTNQILKENGYPIYLFNFAADRTKGFFMLKKAMHKGLLKFPKIAQLIEELNILQEVKQVVNTVIKAPDSQNDDCCDSLMMACFPFLDEKNDFKSFVVLSNWQSMKKRLDERKYGQRAYAADTQWEELDAQLVNWGMGR